MRSSVHARKIILEADKTLWPFVVNANHTNEGLCRRINERNHQRILNTLRMFQSSGSDLYIASRSFHSKNVSCLLRKLYPGIEWDDKQIQWNRTKPDQIKKILGNPKDPFLFFDYDERSLMDVKRVFGDQCKVFKSEEILHSVFVEYV